MANAVKVSKLIKWKTVVKEGVVKAKLTNVKGDKEDVDKVKLIN